MDTRKTFLNILSASGAPQISLKLFRNPRILLYHGVTDKTFFQGIENYRRKHIKAEAFYRQIAFLKSHFNIISLEELVKAQTTKPSDARGSLAITFDDGYKNNFRVAWPILREHKVPFAIFVPTDFIDNKEPLWVDRLEYAINKSPNKKISVPGFPGRAFPLENYYDRLRADFTIREYVKSLKEHEKSRLIDAAVRVCGVDLSHHIADEPDYAPLTWEELREMYSSGLLSVGSHSLNHASATSLSSLEFKKEAIESKSIIEERLGKKCLFFAYPNGKPGDFSAKTDSILKDAGFAASFTTEMKLLNKSRASFSFPRLAMDNTDNKQNFIFTVSGVRILYRAMRNFIIRGQFSPDVSVNSKYKIDPVGHFDSIAEQYKRDYAEKTPRGYSFRIRRKNILKLMDYLPPGAKVLDMGCGPGVYTEQFLERNFNVWGVDPAPEMIKIAKDRFGQNNHAHFFVGNAENIEFDDGYFDSVVAAGLYEYLKDLDKCFLGVNRALVPGGTFIATFPYSRSLPRMWDRILSKIARRRSGRKPKITSREFKTDEVVKLMEDSGFDVKKIVFYNPRLLFTPLDRVFPKFAAWLSSRAELLAPSFLKTGFIVMARKR